MKEIETKRLLLREPKMSDAKDMFENWASDPKVNKHVSWPLHKDIETSKKVLGFSFDEIKEGNYKWFIVNKETNEVMGDISIVGRDTKYNTCELGYCLGSKFWNQGYASEALKGVIEYLLNEENIRLVECKHVSNNPASGRVMQKAGMHYDGTLPQRRIDKDGNIVDLVYYSITK